MTKRVNRRAALRSLAAAGIGIASAPSWVQTLSALAREQAAHVHAGTAVGSQGTWAPTVLTTRQNETVATLCELIIPQTETPGAKEALVNRFIDSVLDEAEPSERKSFLQGLSWMDARSKALFGKDVLSASPEDQTSLLTRLSSEETEGVEQKVGRDFFQALKAMTIAGYYTTPIGLRQELGDDGQLFLVEFKGCTHPEHQG